MAKALKPTTMFSGSVTPAKLTKGKSRDARP